MTEPSSSLLKTFKFKILIIILYCSTIRSVLVINGATKRDESLFSDLSIAIKGFFDVVVWPHL